MPARKSARVLGSGTTVAVDTPLKLVFSGNFTKFNVKSPWNGIPFPPKKVTIVPPSSNEPISQVAKSTMFMSWQLTVLGLTVAMSKTSFVMVSPVPLGLMSFSKKHEGDVKVMPSSVSLQGLVAGLDPDEDKMVKSGTIIPVGNDGSPPPCLIVGSPGFIESPCAGTAHKTTTRLNATMRSDFINLLPPNPRRY
jgi:hypothetical protein